MLTATWGGLPAGDRRSGGEVGVSMAPALPWRCRCIQQDSLATWHSPSPHHPPSPMPRLRASPLEAAWPGKKGGGEEGVEGKQPSQRVGQHPQAHSALRTGVHLTSGRCIRRRAQHRQGPRSTPTCSADCFMNADVCSHLSRSFILITVSF